MRKFIIGALVLAVSGWIGGKAAGQATPADKQPITPAEFKDLQAVIKPKPGGFESIPWMTSLWEARKKAAAEGKPLFIWSGEGHPLGGT